MKNGKHDGEMEKFLKMAEEARKKEIAEQAWQKVGSLCIDTGSVVMGDPCAFQEDGNPPLPKFDYKEDGNVSAEVVIQPYESGATATILVGTHDGDMHAPVYVLRAPSGRPRAVLIILDEDNKDFAPIPKEVFSTKELT